MSGVLENPVRGYRIPTAVLAFALFAPASFAQDPAKPPADPAAKYQLDKDLRIFQSFRDREPFRREDESPDEYKAYNAVLLHARDFPAADLEKNARRDVTFKDLFRNADEFRLELIYLDGRLKQLRRTEPTKDLAAAGVKDLYEGWLFPRDEVNPVCVLFTDLPPGLATQADLKADYDRWVGFAGYSFKLLSYETRQADKKNPGRNVFRLAPVLMGRSATPLADPAGVNGGAGGDDIWYSAFLPMVAGGVGVVGLTVVGLAWFFRRGDRAARAVVEARKDANPFAADGGPANR